MAKPILKLNRLSKIYIMGDQKNARKAMKAMQKLQRRYENAFAGGDQALIKRLEIKLAKAQTLFAKEEYEQSYRTATGEHLKKRGSGDGVVVHALNGVNLTIEPGELVAVMGPSGSGKSTLLNMLGLLDEPTAGQIFIRGQNVAGIKHGDLPAIRSKQLGFVFQSFNLIPTLTALENVMLPLKYAGISSSQRKVMAQAALDQVGLGDRLHHSPNQLSGGQRQRVAIARSIVNSPAVILADELTGELDSVMSAKVMKLIVKLNKQGHTFIIVTHNPEVAKVCKRVIMMRDGRIEKEKIHGRS